MERPTGSSSWITARRSPGQARGGAAGPGVVAATSRRRVGGDGHVTEPLLGVAGLAARRGRPQILRGIDLKALPEACSHQPAPTAPGSTLVGAIAGMYPPAEGRVRLAGRDVTGMAARADVTAPSLPRPRTASDLERAHRRGASDPRRVSPVPAQPSGRARGHRAPPAPVSRLGEMFHRPGGHLSGGSSRCSRLRGCGREIIRTLRHLRTAEGLSVLLVEQNLETAMTIANRLCAWSAARSSWPDGPTSSWPIPVSAPPTSVRATISSDEAHRGLGRGARLDPVPAGAYDPGIAHIWYSR